MADVFISYRRTQRPEVEQIALLLRELGLQVWFDADLSGGERFGDEIDREVRNARAVLVCWSPEALEAPYVRAEAHIGFENKNIVATWVKGPDNPKIPVPFNGLQTEDLRSWIESPDLRHHGWRAVLRRIGRLTERPDLAEWSHLHPESSVKVLAAWIQNYGDDHPLASDVQNLLDHRRTKENVRERRRPSPAPPTADPPRRPKPATPFWRRLLGEPGEIAIDLGTANIRVVLPGKGVVLDEPTVIAVEAIGGVTRVRAVGDAVAPLLARREDSVKIIRPLRRGIIEDGDKAAALLRDVIGKVRSQHALPSTLDVIIGTPAGATPLQVGSFGKAALQAGARKVALIETPMAAAIGAALPVTEPTGSMIVDLGAGKGEVAILSVRGLAYTVRIGTGGIDMDVDISEYLRRRHNLKIGEATAETVKKRMGFAHWSAGDGISLAVRGRDLINGVPREIAIEQRQITEALSSCVSNIVEAVRLALENAPPEHSADIVDQGIVLTGGVALLEGLDRVIREETGLPVFIADEAPSCVANGMGAVLENSAYRSVLFTHQTERQRY